MPSGVTGDWGNRPRVLASSLAGVRCTSLPSRTTRPARGASSRDMERSSVDLPQAVAPTMTVIRPAARVRSRPSMTTRSP